MRTLLLTAAIIAFNLSARADAIYTYTGQDFTNTYASDGFTSVYTTSDSVMGSITLSQSFAPNINLSDYVTISTVEPMPQFQPVSFTFSDGVETISSNQSNFFLFYVFGTDTTGQITSYSLLIETGTASISLLDDSPGAYGSLNSGDQAQTGTDATGISNAYNNQTGSFAISTTPEPSTFVLLGTGILSVAGVVRRRLI